MDAAATYYCALWHRDKLRETAQIPKPQFLGDAGVVAIAEPIGRDWL
jgi:hypothetical protein